MSLSLAITLAEARQRERAARSNLLAQTNAAALCQRDGRYGAAADHRRRALGYQQELEEAERLVRQLEATSAC